MCKLIVSIHVAKKESSPREHRRGPFFRDPRDTIFVLTTSILLQNAASILAIPYINRLSCSFQGFSCIFDVFHVFFDDFEGFFAT